MAVEGCSVFSSCWCLAPIALMKEVYKTFESGALVFPS